MARAKTPTGPLVFDAPRRPRSTSGVATFLEFAGGSIAPASPGSTHTSRNSHGEVCSARYTRTRLPPLPPVLVPVLQFWAEPVSEGDGRRSSQGRPVLDIAFAKAGIRGESRQARRPRRRRRPEAPLRPGLSYRAGVHGPVRARYPEQARESPGGVLSRVNMVKDRRGGDVRVDSESGERRLRALPPVGKTRKDGR